MNNIQEILTSFIKQAHVGKLTTSNYPREWLDLRMKASFGMGTAARVPWIALRPEGQEVSRGINPVYLYYKEFETLILAYGISESEESLQMWPVEITSVKQTVSAFFDKDVPRYGDSFVFKAYKVVISENNIQLTNFETNEILGQIDLESDLYIIVEYFKKVMTLPSAALVINEMSQGLFYMEKELENFIILNWENLELGKKYDLIIEEGELVSQQYRTDIGPIDILVKDKKTGSYVVIELKRNQTSDDTVGQLARYMGWIKENMKDENVKGIIISGHYDKKLDYARKMIQNIEVYIYQVDFKLKEFLK